MPKHNIRFVRIDDRLIHGQVATTWTKVLNIEQILIIDDAAKNDPMMQSVANFAAPPHVKVSIFGVDQFIAIQAKTEIKRATMLLFANVLDTLKVIEAGVEVPYVNAGGMRFREGRRQMTKAISVTPEENQAFKALIQRGIDIQIQMVPKDPVEHYHDVYSD
ncbi:PTS sugar transporter subunit IIB [Abiotrophia defectiva]|uniref:PTS system mannose/fructose/N-acetylgalactosamine-transporter subunit IIB n=1 Tax=Abiotrophia defectiva TaxID=46125 RepID=UPI0028D40B31|nr:PTS sugar transporter subunit IIB [Abiotrophia defectiva]